MLSSTAQKIQDDELEKHGGHCVHPGCTKSENLDWHHVDPATKLFRVAHATKYSIQEVIDEYAKCVPLCKPHHMIADRLCREKAEGIKPIRPLSKPKIPRIRL